jgi:ATP-dependent Zn protease
MQQQQIQCKAYRSKSFLLPWCCIFSAECWRRRRRRKRPHLEIGKQPNSSRNVSHKSYSISSGKKKSKTTNINNKLFKEKSLQLTIITRNPKNQNCKLCTYISSSFCTYLLQLHYSCFFFFLLLLLFFFFFPTMEKNKTQKKTKNKKKLRKKRVHTNTNKNNKMNNKRM